DFKGPSRAGGDNFGAKAEAQSVALYHGEFPESHAADDPSVAVQQFKLYILYGEARGQRETFVIDVAVFAAAERQVAPMGDGPGVMAFRRRCRGLANQSETTGNANSGKIARGDHDVHLHVCCPDAMPG